MNRRHQRALRRVSILAFFLAIPIGFLAYLHETNVEVDVTEFGVVPDFFYTFSNNPVGITHFDTEQYPMLIAWVDRACVEGCPQVESQLESLQSFVNEELQYPTSYKVNFPRSVRLIVMSREHPPKLELEGWDLAVLRGDKKPLVPEVRRDAERPAVVLIDDASFFRAYVPLSDEKAYEKLTREMTRIVSHHSLMHYVTQQTLMWRKQSGRALKEETETH